MNIKNILNEGKSHYSKMTNVTKGLTAKWEKTGLLEGLDNDFDRNGVATLLENQARQLVKEASSTGTTANSEEWAGVALPLVRRIFSEIAAKEFVSVQPMNLPSGLVFYLDFKYGTDQPGFATGSGKDSQADSVFGITDTTDDASGGLYGAGRFGYTINEVDATLTKIDTLADDKYTTGSAAAASVWNYDTQFSQSNASDLLATSHVIKVVTVNTASIANFDPQGIRGFRISDVLITDQYPQFTTLSGGTIKLVAKCAAGVWPATAVIKYHKAPTDTTRGDFETTKAQMALNPETDIDIPELNVEMKSEAIVAKTRKLKAQWSPEFAQDLNAYHSIDAEAELTSMLSEYI